MTARLSDSQRYERADDTVRDLQALLIAARETGGLDHLPADPALHEAASRAVRILYMAEDRVDQYLKHDGQRDGGAA